MPRKGYIPLIASVFILSLISCGLPDYSSLEKPVMMTKVDFIDDPAEPDLPNTVIAFKTPVNDTNILGYSIFYKVYYSDSADPDFILQPGAPPETKVDKDYFDEFTYINDNVEMQPGDTIPNQRGYLKIGIMGSSTFGEYTIANPGPNEAIYIDFDPDGEGASQSDPNKRLEPVIGYDYNEAATPHVFPEKILVRGFLDPADQTEYSLTSGFDKRRSGLNPGKTFRSFVADWKYDRNDDNDHIFDGDLRRAYYVISHQPSDYGNLGDPFFSGDPLPATPAGDVVIGIVVFSFGRNISGGQLTAIASKPVYIGSIKYTDFHEVNRY